VTNPSRTKRVAPDWLSGAFSALLLVNFTGALGFSIVMPFLVFLVHKWGGNALIYGLVSAAYSVFQLIGSPVLGRWSDRYGRKRILFLSQLGTALSWMVVLAAFYIPASTVLDVDSSLLGKFSLTLPLVLLFFSRALDGITAADSAAANALVADITPEDQRDERFGKMGVSSNLGYMIGPAMAGVLGGTMLGYELPIIFAMGISIFAVMLIIFTLPNPKPTPPCVDPHATNAQKVMGQELCPSIQAKSPTKLSMAELFRLPGISVFMATYFLVMLAFNFFYVAFPVQAATEMQWTVKHTGAFFSVMSVFMVVVQGAILPRLSKVWSEKRLVCTGGVVLALGFLALSPANDWVAFLAAILIALGNGLMWPPIVALLSKAAGENQGAVLGMAGGVSAAASILGLFLGGLMYPHFGDWLFFLSAGLILAVVVLTPWFPREETGSFNKKSKNEI
jgi:DHA1 family tetracycline resistance protein-like MFS transporter